jgi:hypothetical protein
VGAGTNNARYVPPWCSSLPVIVVYWQWNMHILCAMTFAGSWVGV